MKQKFFLGQSFHGFHKLAYTEFGKPGALPTVICVHGFTRNGRDFDDLAEALAAKGRHVVCPDMVGCGLSDWAAHPSVYSYPQYLADLTVLLGRIGGESFDWVGTSMGGLLGMFMAAQKGTPVRRLVMNDVGPELSGAALRRIGRIAPEQKTFDNLAALEAHLRRVHKGFGALTDAQWKHMACTSALPAERGKIKLAYDPVLVAAMRFVLMPLNFWASYDKIRIPVLVLKGEESPILSASIAKAMTERGPCATVLTFPRVGHAPALVSMDQIKPVMDFLS